MAAEPITLYLDLEPGQVADLEVVARASLKFAAAIREIAFFLDPSMEVRIELESGTEGSLSINAFIRSLQDKAREHPILAAVAVFIMGWFGNYALDEMADALRGKEKVEISDEQVEEIVRRLQEAQNSRVGAAEAQSVYKELQDDPAIKGVGASRVHGKKPEQIIPKSEFPARADPAILVPVVAPTRRTRERPQRLRIVSPVLLLTKERRWRFLSEEGEFGAPVKDTDFLDDLMTGRVVLPMTGGVEIDALVETVEDFVDGVWVIREWNVLRVYRHHLPPTQQGLGLRAENPDESRS